MSGEDAVALRQKAREDAKEALETLQKQLLDLLNAFEEAITEFKRQVAAKHNVTVDAAVKEETFECLKFEAQKGAKIGEYDVAYKEQNLPEHWNHAYNILRLPTQLLALRRGQNLPPKTIARQAETTGRLALDAAVRR